MFDDIYLGIKASELILKYHKKILELVMMGEDTIKTTGQLQEFKEGLKSLLESWKIDKP